MSTKPLANRLDEITRSLAGTLANSMVDSVARQIEREQKAEQALPAATPSATPRSLRAEAAAHPPPAARRIPTPAPSPLVSASIRTLIQEEARLHWHHRDLPVSRFSACMLLPG